MVDSNDDNLIKSDGENGAENENYEAPHSKKLQRI